MWDDLRGSAAAAQVVCDFAAVDGELAGWGEFEIQSEVPSACAPSSFVFVKVADASVVAIIFGIEADGSAVIADGHATAASISVDICDVAVELCALFVIHFAFECLCGIVFIWLCFFEDGECFFVGGQRLSQPSHFAVAVTEFYVDAWVFFFEPFDRHKVAQRTAPCAFFEKQFSTFKVDISFLFVGLVGCAKQFGVDGECFSALSAFVVVAGEAVKVHAVVGRELNGAFIGFANFVGFAIFEAFAIFVCASKVKVCVGVAVFLLDGLLEVCDGFFVLFLVVVDASHAILGFGIVAFELEILLVKFEGFIGLIEFLKCHAESKQCRRIFA